MTLFVHETAIVEPGALVGSGTRIWHFSHIRSGARIGNDCVLAKGVYVDAGVIVGNRVKIQNNASLYDGVELEDGVFIGPHVCFTNDLYPRAVNPDGSLKGAADWATTKTRIKMGASIGANSTIVCGVEIGAWAMVAAGSVVTRSVPAHALVRGNPARRVAVVGADGDVVARPFAAGDYVTKTGQPLTITDE